MNEISKFISVRSILPKNGLLGKNKYSINSIGPISVYRGVHTHLNILCLKTIASLAPLKSTLGDMIYQTSTIKDIKDKNNFTVMSFHSFTPIGNFHFMISKFKGSMLDIKFRLNMIRRKLLNKDI